MATSTLLQPKRASTPPKSAAMSEAAFEPWIGVDLDGTLAFGLEDYSDPRVIGEPIPEMVKKVQAAIAAGKTVRVFTARLADKERAAEIKKAIFDYTKKHLGTGLDSTNEKNPGLAEYWDDKARRVVSDTGKFAVAKTATGRILPSWAEFVSTVQGGMEAAVVRESLTDHFAERYPHPLPDNDALAEKRLIAFSVRQMKRRYTDLRSFYTKLKFPLDIYRGLELDEKYSNDDAEDAPTAYEDINFESTGVSWTWDRTAAARYDGMVTREPTHILHARAREQDIDWDRTLQTNLWLCDGPIEKEVRVKEHASILLVDVEEVPTHTVTPMNKMITASASRVMTAGLVPGERTFYHGMDTKKKFDHLKPTGGDPFLWLGELGTARDLYANRHENGHARTYEVHLKPDARLADLTDPKDPFREYFIEYLTRKEGEAPADEKWISSYRAIHVNDKAVKRLLKMHGYVGVIVNDSTGSPVPTGGVKTVRHHSIALWDMNAIESQQEMPKTAAKAPAGWIGPLYHGGPVGEPWDCEIRNNKYAVGRYYSTSEAVAKAYGPEVYSAYLKLSHPFTVDAEGNFYDSVPVPKEMRDWVVGDWVEDGIPTDLIADWAYEKGYDGVIVKNVIEPKAPGVTADDYIVFNINQVRRADTVGERLPKMAAVVADELITPEAPPSAPVTPEFKSWFGASKVVNEDWTPRVVFHGSRSPWLTNFDLHCEGTGLVSKAKNGVIWFTSSRDNASWYADYKDKFEADADNPMGYGEDGQYYAAVSSIAEAEKDESEHIFDVGPYPTMDEAEEAATKEARLYNAALHLDTFVTAAYLQMVKPLYVKVVPRAKEFDAARRGGYDGIIATDVVDGAVPSDIFVVFSPSQIKSATRNSGAYSPADTSITAGGIDKPYLEAFMKDFYAGTYENPFNPREQVWKDCAAIECRPFDNAIHVNGIRSFEKGKGQGSDALQWVCSLADKHQVELHLNAVPFQLGGGGLKQTNLRAWYVRNGFKPENGSNMVRRPTAKMPAGKLNLSEGTMTVPMDTVSEEAKPQTKLKLRPAHQPKDKTAAVAEAPVPAPTENPAFKTWFGQSKVVDTDGSPLRVFHGTGQEFDTFKGDGFAGWFTPRPELADLYAERDWQGMARVMPVFLSIQNPLFLPFDIDADADVAEAFAREHLGIHDEEWGRQMAWQVVHTASFAQAVRAKGYDGLHVTQSGTPTWAALNPTQIKSAIGNNGEYDPASKSLTAAARGVYFHGSSIKNLQSILKQGLVPDVKTKNFNEDTQSSSYSPSIESYGGIYVSQNFLAAYGAPKDHYEEGREVMVCMELQPNTLFLDEDNVTGALNGALGRLSDHQHSVGMQFLLATQGGPEWVGDAVERSREEYVTTALSHIKHNMEKSGNPMHPKLEERVTQMLREMWPVALARLAAQHFKGNDGERTLHRAWSQIYGSKDKPMPPIAELVPTVPAAEKDFRDHAEKFTRTLKSMLRPDADGKQTTTWMHGRVTEPIGYSGSNRITAVIEIRDGDFFTERGKKPAQLVVHYGEIPKAFMEEWRQRRGGEVEVAKAAAFIPKASLIQYAMKARQTVLGGRAAVDGDCISVVEELYDIVSPHGLAANMVAGTFKGHPHTWLTVDGTLVDPTYEQFGGDRPVLVTSVARGGSYGYKGNHSYGWPVQRVAGETLPTIPIDFWAKKFLAQLGDQGPVPKIHIVDTPGSTWLGLCTFNWGEGETEEIKIQKRVMRHLFAFMRVLAHELCHHVAAKKLWAEFVRDDPWASVKEVLAGDGGLHGRSWKAEAAKLNGCGLYGEDFVTEKSDAALETLIEPIEKAATYWNERTPEDRLARAKNWVERSGLPIDAQNRVRLYHATPTTTAPIIEKEGLRQDSMLATDPQSAIHYAGRDRELQADKITCFECWIPMDAFRPSVFVTLDRALTPQAMSMKPVAPVSKAANADMSPAFKAWFAGSKVVNPDGSPTVLYHATQADIDIFKPFTHFGTQDAANQRYTDTTSFYNEVLKNPGRSEGSNIIPVYLSIKNPLRLPDLASIDTNGAPMPEKEVDAVATDDDENDDRHFPRGWEDEAAIASTCLEKGIFDIDEYEEFYYNEQAIKHLATKGYDGIVYKNVVEDAGKDSWIVFEPNQVKSAIGNGGGFDPNNHSISAAKTASNSFPTFEEFMKGWNGSGRLNTEDAERYADWVEFHENRFYPMDIFRAVRAAKVEDIDTSRTGVCWTWDEDCANVYIRTFQGEESHDFILRGKAHFDQIDWGYTIYLNMTMDDTNNVEKEIRLKDRADVEITGVREDGYREWQPFHEQMVTAAATKVAAISEAGHEYLAAAGDTLIEEVTIGDYEFFLVKSGIVDNLYEVGLQRSGMDAFQPDQQRAKQPNARGRGSLEEMKALMNRWLAKYKELVIASHNDRKTAEYVRLAHRLGFTVGSRTIMGIRFPALKLPGAGKLVTAAVKTVRAYHGTTAAFDTFNCPAMFYIKKSLAEDIVAGQPDGRVVEAMLTFGKPADLDAMHLSPSAPDFKEIAKKLEAEGYDGAQYKNQAWIAFRPEQIRRIDTKVAAHRIGDFFAIAYTEMLPCVASKFEYWNDRDKATVKKYMDDLQRDGELAPILVTELKTGKYMVMDGNHRLEASLRSGAKEIEAYVISQKDLNVVLKHYFGGQLPEEMSELDDYVLLDDDGMCSYSKRASRKPRDLAAVVEAAIEAVGGSSETISGNCGMFAIALAKWLKTLGYAPTIGVWTDAHRNTPAKDVLTDKHASMEHVCVECEGKLWDGEGERNEASVEGIIAEERGYDVRVTYFGGYSPDDLALMKAIQKKTSHWTPVVDMLSDIQGAKIASAQSPKQSILVVVHPGSCCGSADYNLGQSDARAGRDGLVLEWNGWTGGGIVIDGDLSDELPEYPALNRALNGLLARAKAAGMTSLRLDGPDPQQNVVIRKIVQQQKFDPKTTRFICTGAWSYDGGDEGCVGGVNKVLLGLGFTSEVSDYALTDSDGEDDDPTLKSSAKKVAMQITVPPSEMAHFFSEPPADCPEEFWGLRWKPSCAVGDTITFNLDKQPIAEAVVSRIERPGESECGASGRFRNLWKVFWRNTSFHKLDPIH